MKPKRFASGRFRSCDEWIFEVNFRQAGLRSGNQYLLTLADFSLENHDYAVPNRQSPGSFPESSSGLDVEGSRKISCCFPKGTVSFFL
jgi:hypothetical protein